MANSEHSGPAAALERYFSGRELYGDDFGPEALERWFEQERDAYFKLASEEHGPSSAYEYGALNSWHGFRFLKHVQARRVLAMGAADGKELQPLLKSSPSVTVVEPSDGFVNPRFRYVKPDPSGRLPFADGSFDVVTCFAVLHHIANVSTVLRELYRCLEPGGHVLLREPIISMGDWSGRRPGLTPCERGIPLGIFDRILAETGFVVVRRHKCFFAPLQFVQRMAGRPLYNSLPFVILDHLVCALPWPQPYHAARPWQKLRSQCVFFLLRRPGSAGNAG